MRDMDAEPTAHIAWGADGRLSQKWIITTRNGPYIKVTEEWRPDQQKPVVTKTFRPITSAP